MNKVKEGDIILAIPSSGLHSNGFSLVRTILKRNKLPKILKKFTVANKIYVSDVLKLFQKILLTLLRT